MRLDKITLENFLTYESLEYNIPRTPLLVQGKNLTEEDQESNGSGKSGIFTAIEFCIAGTNSRGVKDKELVQFGSKEAKLTLEASCDVRKESIRIEWTVKVKGSNVLTIGKKEYDGEWQRVSFSNVNDGKKWISDWFAIDKDDLFNYYIINKQRFKSFFKASNKEKVDLINRFSDASIIDGLEDIDNTELQVEHDNLKSQLDKIDGKIELTQEQIAEENEDDSTEKLSLIEARLTMYEKDLDELDEEVEEIQEEKEALEKKEIQAQIKVDQIAKAVVKADKILEDFEMVNYKEQMSDLDEEETVLDIKERKVAKLIKELTVELEGAISCPSCGHEFTLDCKHGTLEEVNDKLHKAESIEKQIEDKISAIASKLQDLRIKDQAQREKRDELAEQNNDLYKANREAQETLKDIQDSIKQGDQDLKDIELEKKEIALKVKEAKAALTSQGGPDEERIKTLESNLDTLRKERMDVDGKYIAKGDEIYERNKWKNNFKQFRMHLANNSLEAIEFHMNRYLTEMQSDLRVKMEGFKMLSNGTFKDEITAHIIRNVQRSFASFSAGEQGRLLFAAILANRHMLNSTHPYGGLDFLSVDEIFEGVDSMGLKSLVRSAKLLNIAVMIVTHVTDENVNEDILLIEKVNGVSSIRGN